MPPHAYQRRIANRRGTQALTHPHAEIRPELPGDLLWRGCLNNAPAHGGRIAGGGSFLGAWLFR